VRELPAGVKLAAGGALIHASTAGALSALLAEQGLTPIPPPPTLEDVLREDFAKLPQAVQAAFEPVRQIVAAFLADGNKAAARTAISALTLPANLEATRAALLAKLA